MIWAATPYFLRLWLCSFNLHAAPPQQIHLQRKAASSICTFKPCVVKCFNVSPYGFCYNILKGKIEEEKWAGSIKRDGEFEKSLDKKLEKSYSRGSLDEKRRLERN